MTCEPGECRLDEDGACIVNFKKPLFSPTAHLIFKSGSAARIAESLIAHSGTPPRWILRFFRWAHRVQCAECTNARSSR